MTARRQKPVGDLLCIRCGKASAECRCPGERCRDCGIEIWNLQVPWAGAQPFEKDGTPHLMRAGCTVVIAKGSGMTIEESQKMIAALCEIEDGLSPWEADFVDSLSKRDPTWELSDKQKAVLRRIYDKKAL